jgi:hypothetical protein
VEDGFEVRALRLIELKTLTRRIEAAALASCKIYPLQIGPIRINIEVRGALQKLELSHVRLQSTGYCLPTGEGRRQFGDDTVLEHDYTRILSTWRT